MLPLARRAHSNLRLRSHGRALPHAPLATPRRLTVPLPPTNYNCIYRITLSTLYCKTIKIPTVGRRMSCMHPSYEPSIILRVLDAKFYTSEGSHTRVKGIVRSIVRGIVVPRSSPRPSHSTGWSCAGVCLRVCLRVCVRVFVSWFVRVCPLLGLR